MKKLFMLVAIAVLFAACEKNVDVLNQDELMLKGASKCVTLQKDVLTYSEEHYLAGEPIAVGYDIFGYNYQAHMFNGSYANAYLGRVGFPPYEGNDESYLSENPDAENHWAWEYRNNKLSMKWNDAWLANKDCDDDGILDRHYGFDSYSGSGAWLTNHEKSIYEDKDGNICESNSFVKIIAAPADAYADGGVWYNADDTEIGPVIWGAFAIIQEVINDPCAGLKGIHYKSPDHAGLGNW